MRTLVILLLTTNLAACSALMVSGGNAGNNPYQNDSTRTSPSSNDAAIVASVRNRLAADARINMFDFDVTASNGKVILAGTVDSYAARERAEQLAIGTAGVTSVDNRIKVPGTN